MLKHAFKEWAVICEALVQGRQAILLRKGGVRETVFVLEHARFWLYPTYTHQQRDGVREEALPLLQDVDAARPSPGVLRLQAWAEVTGVYQVRDALLAQMLAHLHLWSDESVHKRFEYRKPEINVLTTRVHRIPAPHELVERTAYEGCRSWVELEEELSTQGSTPVLSDEEYLDVKKSLDLLLKPIALV